MLTVSAYFPEVELIVDWATITNNTFYMHIPSLAVYVHNHDLLRLGQRPNWYCVLLKSMLGEEKQLFFDQSISRRHPLRLKRLIMNCWKEIEQTKKLWKDWKSFENVFCTNKLNLIFQITVHKFLQKLNTFTHELEHLKTFSIENPSNFLNSVY